MVTHSFLATWVAGKASISIFDESRGQALRVLLRKECCTITGTVPDDRGQETGVRDQESEVPNPSDHPRICLKFS